MTFKSGMERMHVLYLPRWYPNNYDPMPGLFIQRHGMAASAFTNISVLYVHPDNNLENIKYKLEITEENGLFRVAVYIKKAKSRIKLISKIIDFIRYIKAHQLGLDQIKKYRGEPDLVHVHVMTRLAALAYLYKFFTGTPYLITEHWTRYLASRNEFNGFLRKRLSRWIAKKAKAILPVSEDLKKAMLSHKLSNNNYIVVPNVVDTELFTIADKKDKNLVKQFVHLSCFTDSHKNISGILRTLKKLSEANTNFHCTFIGDGPDFETLKSYAKKIGIDSMIHFTGLLEGKDVAEELKKADLMLLFSNHENLPVVILESYACGIPVISTRVGGIQEHINPELGKLIERGNEEELLSELKIFLGGSKNYNQQKIRDYALQHFSKKAIGKTLYTIYSTILEKK